MPVNAWKWPSAREDRRLSEDRKSLIERYTIDNAEAEARAQRAAEEEAKRAAEAEARRAAEEAKRRAEEQARLAAKDAKRKARADRQAERAAEEQARRVAKEAKRATRAQSVIEPVAALRLAEHPAAAPPVADELPATAEIVEPREQVEPDSEYAPRLPIYGWLDAPAPQEEGRDPGAFSVGRRGGRQASDEVT